MGGGDGICKGVGCHWPLGGREAVGSRGPQRLMRGQEIAEGLALNVAERREGMCGLESPFGGISENWLVD